ncbi:MAG: alpha/beta hydrolase, partial [bacterium]|nr:alpha/beta hydrolase [bacterium]
MISPPIKQESFLHKRLQSLVANALFPKGDGDWYKNKGYGNQNTIAFADFIHQQKTNEHALYYKAFKHLNFNLSLVPSELSTQEQCEIEVFKAAPEPSAPLKPGSGKHIIYFPGANTYYQACFRDISTAC